MDISNNQFFLSIHKFITQASLLHLLITTLFTSSYPNKVGSPREK